MNWHRLGFWTACVLAFLVAPIAVFEGLAAHWLWFSLDVACLPLNLNSVRIFRRQLTPAGPVASRHDQCLAEIKRLEGELANDGVLFAMPDDQFDRAVAAATHTSTQTQLQEVADRINARISDRYISESDGRRLAGEFWRNYQAYRWGGRR